jgi:ribose transport system substrate-binding protein
MRCGAQSEAKKLGVSLNWQAAATPDVSAVLTTLNSATITKPDGVVLGPSSPTAFVAPVQALMRKGVPVVVNDSPLSQNVGLRNVLSDNAAGAKQLIQPLESTLGAHGTLGVIAYAPGSTGDMQRYHDLLASIRTQLPGVKVLPLQYTLADSSKSAQVAQSMIRGNPGLTAIYATNGPQAIGAASGIQAAGATGRVKLFAFDATPQEVSGVRRGTFAGIVGQSPFLEGATAVQQLVGYLGRRTGADPVTPASPYVTYTPVKLLDKANIGEPSSRPYMYLPSC